MAGAQVAAASAAVVLEMDMLSVEKPMSSGRGSQVSLHSHHSYQSANTSEHHGDGEPHANGSVSHVDDVPTVVLSQGQLDIREFYESVKAPGTKENLSFAAEVDQRLKLQEEKALPPEDILDQAGAEGTIFGKWLIQKLGSADTALLQLTAQKWLKDNLTATIVKGLFQAHDASPKATGPSGRTCLHLCTANQYNATIEVIFSKDPLLWMVRDNDGNLPLEVALDGQFPETSVLIMSAMPNTDVRAVFGEKRRPFYKLLSNMAMKDVTHAIMDRMLDAWPDDGKGRGFDFHYAALETDTEGRAPDSPEFEGSSSCFMSILKKSKLAKEFSQDRIVRMLLYTKWNSYGEKMLWVSTLSFIIFMIALTFADVTAVDTINPESYTRPLDYARAVCEVIVLIVLVYSLISEIIELAEKRLNYLTEVYNYVQLVSILLILIVVPLRFLEVRSQWVLLSVGYLVTTIRIFKFISASSLIGVYTRVLVGICSRVLPKFFLIFSLALFVWAGAFYPALRTHVRGRTDTTTEVTDTEGMVRNVTSSTIREDKGLIRELENYGEVLFLGFRVLVEGRNLIQYYQDSQQLGAMPVILYMLFLIGVVLIMRTILIAQMAATFGAMNRDAVRQVEMNRAWVLPDLEGSKIWDLALKGWRVRFYEPFGEFSDKKIQQILQEEKVDGFLKMEKLLAKQKQQLESQQQQTVGQLTHQTILQEKWTSQLMQAVHKAEQGLGVEVKASQDMTNTWGTNTVSGITAVRTHLGEQLEEAQEERTRAALSTQEQILSHTREISTNLVKVEGRLSTQERRQEEMETKLGLIDVKLVKQGEQSVGHTQQISTLSQTEAVSSESKDKKLQSLDDKLDEYEEENRALTKRLNQQGFQLEQVLEMLQRLEVSSNKLISEVSVLRRTSVLGSSAASGDFAAKFDDKLMRFEQASKDSSLPKGLAGIASSLGSGARPTSPEKRGTQ